MISGTSILKGIGSILSTTVSGYTKYIIFAAILAIGGASFYWYYSDTQKRLKTNADILAKQELAIEVQKTTIAELTRIEGLKTLVMDQLYKNLEEARKQAETPEPESNIPDPVTGMPFDMNQALQKDLGGTEDFLNKQFNNNMKCFSLYSGVKIEELEKDVNEQNKLRTNCGINPTVVP